MRRRAIAQRGRAFPVLEHAEDGFLTRQFVNTSVAQLAECLLACTGENQPARLRAAIKNIDPPAAAANSFWDEAVRNLGSVKEAE